MNPDALTHLADAMLEDIVATPPHQLAIEELADSRRSRELMFRFDDILAEASAGERPATLGRGALLNLTDALCEDIPTQGNAGPHETADGIEDCTLAAAFDDIVRRDPYLATAGLIMPLRSAGLSRPASYAKAAFAVADRLIPPLRSRAAVGAFATAVIAAILTAAVCQYRSLPRATAFVDETWSAQETAQHETAKEAPAADRLAAIEPDRPATGPAPTGGAPADESALSSARSHAMYPRQQPSRRQPAIPADVAAAMSFPAPASVPAPPVPLQAAPADAGAKDVADAPAQPPVTASAASAPRLRMLAALAERLRRDSTISAGAPNRLNAWMAAPAHDTATEGLENAARDGDVVAAWKLGRIYAGGDGVPRDAVRAFEYFRRVVETYLLYSDLVDRTRVPFVANAFVSLGLYYLSGIPQGNLKPDPVHAHQMFLYAATDFEDADAAYYLGRTYLEGKGVTKDPKQAARWLYTAAVKGQFEAQAKFGSLLVRGLGQVMPRDVAKGLMWLAVAKDAAPPDAAARITEIYDAARKQATKDERAAAEVLVDKWRRNLARSPSATGSRP